MTPSNEEREVRCAIAAAEIQLDALRSQPAPRFDLGWRRLQERRLEQHIDTLTWRLTVVRVMDAYESASPAVVAR